MPLMDEDKLDKLATEVVDGYITNRTPLTDGIVKVAEREMLNEEQIRRLVETTNNSAFLHKFSSAETNDRLEATQFEPADANSALQRLIDAAKDLMGGVSAPSAELSPLTELPMTRETGEEPLPPPPAETPATEPKMSGHIMIMRLRKTAEVLRDQHYQKRADLTDTFQKLATTFRRTRRPNFIEFERDVFYKWGNAAIPHLNLLRASLRMEPATYDHAAMTKVARVIDSTQPTMQHFGALLTLSQEIRDIEQGQTKIATVLDEV